MAHCSDISISADCTYYLSYCMPIISHDYSKYEMKPRCVVPFSSHMIGIDYLSLISLVHSIIHDNNGVRECSDTHTHTHKSQEVCVFHNQVKDTHCWSPMNCEYSEGTRTVRSHFPSNALPFLYIMYTYM